MFNIHLVVFRFCKLKVPSMQISIRFFILVVFVLHLQSNTLFSDSINQDKSEGQSSENTLNEGPIGKILLSKGNDRLSYFQPIYFLGGNKDLKLQFSFKYRIFNKHTLFFGFTQTMFWNIYEESIPFRDITFNPELFYRFLVEKNSILAFDIGYSHASNGKAGNESRSMDQAFFRLNTRVLPLLGMKTILIARVFYPVRVGKESPDIRKFVGFWKLTGGILDLISFGEDYSINLLFSVFAGDKAYNLDRGGHEINLILGTRGLSFSPNFFIQYYGGYLEDQLNFDESVNQVRAGFIFPI